MQRGKAVIAHVLGPEFENLLLDEFKCGLERGDRVFQVVFVDIVLVSVLQVAGYGSYARLSLQVLAGYLLIKKVLQAFEVLGGNIHFLQDSKQHCLQTLHVPVLVDACANHPRCED